MRVNGLSTKDFVDGTNAARLKQKVNLVIIRDKSQLADDNKSTCISLFFWFSFRRYLEDGFRHLFGYVIEETGGFVKMFGWFKLIRVMKNGYSSSYRVVVNPNLVLVR